MAAEQVQIQLPEDERNQYMKYRQEDERYGESLAKVTGQLEAELNNRRSKFITRRELMGLSDEVPIYRTTGKAFLLNSVAAESATLRQELAKIDERILQFKKLVVYFIGQQDGVRAQMNELLKPFMNK